MTARESNFMGVTLSEAVEKESGFVLSVRYGTNPNTFWSGHGIAMMLSYLCRCTPNDAVEALNVLKKIGDIRNELTVLQNTVNDLFNGPRCCGHKWRNNAGRLYMHHALNEDCPLHGRAPDGADRGLRCYVKAEDEESTLAAAANFELWKVRRSELRQMENKLDSLARQLKNLAGFRGW